MVGARNNYTSRFSMLFRYPPGYINRHVRVFIAVNN